MSAELTRIKAAIDGKARTVDAKRDDGSVEVQYPLAEVAVADVAAVTKAIPDAKHTDVTRALAAGAEGAREFRADKSEKPIRVHQQVHDLAHLVEVAEAKPESKAKHESK